MPPASWPGCGVSCRTINRREAFVDAGDLLRQAVEVVRAMARDRGVRLELSPDQGLPPV